MCNNRQYGNYDDESITTNEIGQNMIFLPNGNIIVTKEQHCIHPWGTTNSISVNQCSQNNGEITFTSDTWILTEKIQNQQLSPLKIIQKHSNMFHGTTNIITISRVAVKLLRPRRPVLCNRQNIPNIQTTNVCYGTKNQRNQPIKCKPFR